jgi:hypothetical protein
VGDNRNCCAIFIGSMNNGEGVSLTGLAVQNCYFTNFPGANVVLVHDRQTDPDSTFSSDVLISGNTFYDNRKADGNRDHSTVNIFADNTRVIGNCFALPATATDLQKQLMAACELHGSSSCFNHNTLTYYGFSVVFSENLHHDCLSQEAVGNALSNHGYVAFYINVSGLEICLELMPWGDGSGVPTSGKKLVILGIDNTGLLHIRIFDAGGKKTDSDETTLPATQAWAISTLKQQLPGLLPPHVLTVVEKEQLISEVTSILGPTWGLFKTVKQINIVGNTVHFGTVVAVTNQTLKVLAPFPKWGVAFYIGAPAALDSLNVTGNTFDGDTLNQASHVVGIAGAWGGGGYWGLTHLNVSGNTFRHLAYGVWQDNQILTVAKHSTIVGNRFEDLADPTTDPDPKNPTFPPAGSARAVYMSSSGGPSGIMSVSASGNSFVNEWNHPTYEYGFYLLDTVVHPSAGENWYPSVGENWYFQIRKTNLAIDKPSGAMVVRLPPLSSRAVVSSAYGPAVTIDPSLGGRFMIVVTDMNAFVIDTPQISGSQATFVDGTEIDIMICNASGGTLGDVAWGASYKTSWSNSTDKPSGAGGGFNITLRFRYDSASSTWLEVSKGSNAVLN